MALISLLPLLLTHDKNRCPEEVAHRITMYDDLFWLFQELRQLIVLEVENEFHMKLTKLRQERDRLREVKKSKQITAVEGKTESYSE